MPTVERTFEQCQDLIADLSFERVHRWKDEHPGAKAIGYFPVYAPLEIIHACGMLPVGLNGAGDRLDIQYADARFGSFICSIVKTTLEMAMTDHSSRWMECCSVHHLRLGTQSLLRDEAQLSQIVRGLPSPAAQPGSAASVDFLPANMRRLDQQLEESAEAIPTDEGLRRAIALYNENRQLIRQLYAFRAQKPHLLRTWEFTCWFERETSCPWRSITCFWKSRWKQLPQRSGKPRDSIRVVVEGAFCEQPPLDLIKLVEEAGCYVVDDDFVIGQSWFVEDVPVDGDPIHRAGGELRQSRRVFFGPPRFPAPRGEGLAEKVKSLRADAVLFLIAKFCEPGLLRLRAFQEKAGGAQRPASPAGIRGKAVHIRSRTHRSGDLRGVAGL